MMSPLGIRSKDKIIRNIALALALVLVVTYTAVYHRHSFELIGTAYRYIPHSINYEITAAWSRMRTVTSLDPDEPVDSPLWRVDIEDIKKRAVKGSVLNYLPEYKCPCWYERSESEAGLRCLPYFYLAGVSKSGTTSLHDQFIKHPDIEAPAVREPYFWTYPTRRNLDGYLNMYKSARAQIYRESVNGYHGKITFEGTPNYLTGYGLVDKYKNNMQNGEPRFTLAHTLYALNPKTKIVVTLRNPTDRLFSDYHYHSFYTYVGLGRGYSIERFHELVVDSIAKVKACLAERSERSCLYDTQLIVDSWHQEQLKLTFGMYYPYIKEWLSVFPRDQIFFIKAEEMYSSAATVLKDAFHFLNLTTPAYVLDDIDAEMSHKHNHEQSAIKSGTSYRQTMLPETKKILDEFYKPYNEQLAALLMDDKWLFH